MLIVFGGLPGTGKTTVARELARQLGAVHPRIDSIEQALRNAGAADHSVRVWETATAKEVARLAGHFAQVTQVLFTRGSRRNSRSGRSRSSSANSNNITLSACLA